MSAAIAANGVEKRYGHLVALADLSFEAPRRARAPAELRVQPAAGGSIRLSWKLNAVNAGHLGVYVAVLPRSGAAVAPVTAPIVSVRIADRRTLDSGGILPLALGLPALLGALTLAVRFTRRRRRLEVTRAGA